VIIMYALFVASTAGCAMLRTDAAPTVPEKLRTSASESLLLEAQAVGVQIYECKSAKDEPTRFEWTFRAPEADLYDKSGNKIGKHYAGPTWESNDGSKVIGQVKAQASSPDTNAIAWLLLGAKETSGTGALARTTSVQRLDTSGGKAPNGGCDRTQAGTVQRVGYKAKYYFYATKS
jgi:uncharacterized protein DUF3455